MLRSSSVRGPVLQPPSPGRDVDGLLRYLARVVGDPLEVADHSCSICLSVRDLKDTEVPRRLRKDIGQLGGKSADALDQSMEAFFGKDVDDLNRVIDLADGMISACDESAEKISRWGKEGVVSLDAIIESIRRSYSYSGNIAEVAINHVVDISS